MVRFINGFYYVVSRSSNKVYKLDKSLRCECKGFQRWGHCKHQDEVINHLNQGKEVDLIGQINITR